MSKGSRAWIYTLNNYSPEEVSAVQGLDCVYNVFGYEVGESGTPHLQGYIQFQHQKTLSAVKKLMPRAYLAPRKGTIDQAVDYCKKDGKYEEFGVKPKSAKEKGDGEKARWREILKRAREGDEEWLEENEPQVAFRDLALFRSHKKNKIEIQDGEQLHEWWYGATGTGKSRKLWEDYPTHYAKPLNKWWNGYTGQDVVAIEEWSPKNDCTASGLKVWADRYPFRAEIKNGVTPMIRPLKIIVLSNYTMEECFNSTDLPALKRRFKEVRFGSPEPAIHPFFNI